MQYWDDDEEEDRYIRRGERRPLLSHTAIDSPILGVSEYHVPPLPIVSRPTLYKWRWIVLSIVALINLSNGMMWMTFSSIAEPTSFYYNVDHDKVNWLSIVFMVTTVPLGLVAIWLLDKHGLRASVMLAAWLNGVGAVTRIVSTLDGLPSSYRYTVLMIGQTLAGCAQPFILFAPTKVASKWFPDNQRTLANMVGSTANPIGIMLGNILSTALVPNSQTAGTRMPILMYVVAAPACLAALFTTICMRSSQPNTAPSPSAAEGTKSFWVGLKMLFRIKQYWLLALCYGGGMGLVSALVTMTDQLMCPQGYSNELVGLCVALLFGVGLGGAVIMSLIVDKTKKFEEVAKIGFTACACSLIAFLVLAEMSHFEILLAVLCSCIGFFGVGISPICLELSVESSYPVAEGMSAGFLVLSGQIQAAALSLLLTLGEQNPDTKTTCIGIVSRYSELAVMGVTAALSLLFISLYRCSYRRRQAEEQLSVESRFNPAESRRHAVDQLSA